MTADQNQNINLLPGDLKRKREVIKKVIASDAVSYTQPQNGFSEKQPEKKKSLISFWGRKGGNTQKSSAPGGLRVSAERFTPTQTPPKPNFLNQSPSAVKPLPKSEPEKPPEPKKEPKESWWRKLFAKKTPTSPALPTLPAKSPVAEKKEELPAVSKVFFEKPVQEKKPEPVMAKPEPELPVPLVTPAPVPEPIAPKEPVLPEKSNGQPKTEKINNDFLPDQGQLSGKGGEFDVNLLSKEYAEVFKIRNQKSVLITWTAITIVIIILAYLGIHLYQLQKSASIRQAGQINIELEKTIATYSSLEQEDALLLQKISSLKTLLGNHIALSNFLRLLEAATTPEVTYTAIAASREGLVTITALGTDYTAVGRQLAILQEHTEWIKDAQITAAQLSKDNQSKIRGVEFDLLLKVDPVVFNNQEPASPQ